jgi:hypothetical protein
VRWRTFSESSAFGADSGVQEWHERCIEVCMHVINCKAGGSMDGIDANQTERVLSYLARLKHQGDPAQMDTLESLRPSWLGMDAWDVVLEDLEAQHYRNRARVVRLQVVAG